MLKKLFFCVAFFFAAAAFAAVDVNQATEADLDGIDGHLARACPNGSWPNATRASSKRLARLGCERVKGIGDKTATGFSAGGLDRTRQTLQRGSLGQGTSQSQEQRRHCTTAGTIQKCFARKSGRRACKPATCCAAPSPELRA